jgi:Alpha/beta hydrolase of unknown function (DUF1023).
MPISRRGARLWRLALAALVAAAVSVPVSAAAVAETPAPAPPALPAISADTLADRYAANRATIALAARMAEQAGNGRRAAALRAMADPARTFLSFEARGDGRVVEVLGDLTTAGRIAILVAGSGVTLESFDAPTPTPYARPGPAARALYEQVRREAGPGTEVAVVTWLDYRPPPLVGVATVTTGRAEAGAVRLRALVAALRRVAPGAPVTLLCHSYGSVVCGAAAAEPGIADIALIGSPGVGAATVRELGTRARVWAGRGGVDWIGDVPHIRLRLLGTTVGFGADPVSPDFGARLFDAGDGGHGDYFVPGSRSLTNLARIALGRAEEVTDG